MIEVEHLTKKFYNTMAVNDISFIVEKGEILGFLGPNGAGKSTTMRILTCFIPQTGGKATVAGFDVLTESLEVRKNIGYLPENVSMYSDMRVEEFLKFRANLKGVPRNNRKQKIDMTMEKCWITDVRRKIIGNLSKGYRQRVALAESLVHDPKILILDEPTVGLDPNQIRETRQLIKDLGKNHTVILCTHILPEVEMICDRVIIINKGKLVAMDTPESLMRKLMGEKILHLEVKGPVNEIKSALEKIKGVEKVFVDKTMQEIIFIKIEQQEKQDIREDVFYEIVKNNWILREMHIESASLEDIFFKITVKEPIVKNEISGGANA
ncbi:ATP-binding cassette domain-containing protein [Candidatus Desantisbacteria bacterium]|nr:ATP-binding cassette domain-containing protein [Candidatus Desantisbacteria bacterium]